MIGLARNKAATDERLANDGITNVVIYQADITDLPALQKASAAAASLLGAGCLDYLINNAAINPGPSSLVDLSHLYVALSENGSLEANHLARSEKSPEVLNEELLHTFQTNVIGVANTITAFLPLIKQSNTKKIIAISSGMADLRASSLFFSVNHPLQNSHMEGAFNRLL